MERSAPRSMHDGALLRRFSIYLRREIAKRAGLSQRTLREHARKPTKSRAGRGRSGCRTSW